MKLKSLKLLKLPKLNQSGFGHHIIVPAIVVLAVAGVGVRILLASHADTPNGGYQAAFQANTGDLWTAITGGGNNLKLGMKPGTSPGITGISAGGYEAAFQANTGDLWTVGKAGDKNWGLGMDPGSSPSITGLVGGGYEAAFESNVDNLWTVNTDGATNHGLGLYPGTTPSITGLTGGGYEVAFEANTGSLYTIGTAGDKDWGLGMMKGTSPSITALTNNSYEIAFQANTGDLWTVGSGPGSSPAENLKLGMKAGTSPSITGLTGGGYEIAFQANTGYLWVAGTGGTSNLKLGMYGSSSPSITNGLTDGDYEIAFESNTGYLWTTNPVDGSNNQELGMFHGSSPVITGLTIPGTVTTTNGSVVVTYTGSDDGCGDNATHYNGITQVGTSNYGTGSVCKCNTGININYNGPIAVDSTNPNCPVPSVSGSGGGSGSSDNSITIEPSDFDYLQGITVASGTRVGTALANDVTGGAQGGDTGGLATTSSNGDNGTPLAKLVNFVNANLGKKISVCFNAYTTNGSGVGDFVDIEDSFDSITAQTPNQAGETEEISIGPSPSISPYCYSLTLESTNESYYSSNPASAADIEVYSNEGTQVDNNADIDYIGPITLTVEQ